ncbi:MAG: hypothetical protein H0W08_23835 [Acidobacteria bacterium]|nr:hypothetical protein [Acidobacteriota bacterium]
MLKRVDADTFAADADEEIRILAKASGNDGHKDARFRYVTMLTRESINGHPGATFDVVQGVRMLSCIVEFAVGADGARYDLFQMVDGSESDLDVSLTPVSTGTTVQFRVRGVPVPALAGAPRRSGAAAGRRRSGAAPGRKRKAARKTRKRAKRATAGRATAKSAPKRKTAKRKTAKRKGPRLHGKRAPVKKGTRGGRRKGGRR